MLKLFRVYDGKSFIGSYRAKNAKFAMQRARDEQAATASTFRKSQPAIVFNNLYAEEIKKDCDDRL